MVITISREFGSGGHEIGEKVAKELGLAFYDKEIVFKVAEQSGFDISFISQQGEYIRNNSLLFNLSARKRINFEDPTDKVFRIQKEIIQNLAKEDNCLIVGRCADYILREAGIDSINIFISSDLKHREKRILKIYGENEIPIRKRLDQADKQRQNYFQYYTQTTWGSRENYHLCLDSGAFGEEACVKAIVDLARSKYEK